jgi:hypothetical protein
MKEGRREKNVRKCRKYVDKKLKCSSSVWIVTIVWRTKRCENMTKPQMNVILMVMDAVDITGMYGVVASSNLSIQRESDGGYNLTQ